MKRSTYIWSLLVGCVAFATSCDLTEDVQVKADKYFLKERPILKLQRTRKSLSS